MAFAKMYTALAVTLLSFLRISVCTSNEYCVIGAGPAGLQMGYFLERAGRDYVILERDSTAGWFYKKYPRHRTLISINKRFTGQTNKEFNMRHDWNSLISDDESLLIKHYTKEFFPPADLMVKYLKDFARQLKLKAKYGVNVRHVSKENDTFVLKDKIGRIFHCRYVIVSTGLWVENKPKNVTGAEYVTPYSKMSVNADDYEGKSLLIIGRGNSGFETAQHLAGAANYIHMMSRERLRFSWETHYVGDLRAVNDGPIDTYQLKSLDGQFEGDITAMKFWKDKNGRIHATDGAGEPDNSAVREPYDAVITCMGFKFDFGIFDKKIRPLKAEGPRKKYPKIKENYESTTTKDLYFAGTIIHSLDWRKSAGGFIHGFRYTTRALHHVLEYRNHGVEWPHVTLPFTEILNTLTKRLNEASGIYQMFNCLVDVIVFRDDGKFEYFEEFPKGLIPEFESHTGRPFTRGIVINLEYGKNFSGPGSDPFKEERATGEVNEAHLSNFLHPVLYYYKKPIEELTPEGNLPRPDRLHHVVEDFLAMWNALLHHHLPLRWFLENAIGEDTRHFFAEDCLQIAMISKDIPVYCKEHYMKGAMLHRPANVKAKLVLDVASKEPELAA